MIKASQNFWRTLLSSSMMMILQIYQEPRTELSKKKAFDLIDDVDGIVEMAKTLICQRESSPSLYFGLGGVELCRWGSVSTLQIHVAPTKRTYLVDIHTLGGSAFAIAGQRGLTLRSVLDPR